MQKLVLWLPILRPNAGQLLRSGLLALATVSAFTAAATAAIGANFVPVIDGLSLFPLLAFYFSILTAVFQLFQSQKAVDRLWTEFNYDLITELLTRRAMARLPIPRKFGRMRDVVRTYRRAMSQSSPGAVFAKRFYRALGAFGILVLLYLLRSQITMLWSLSGGPVLLLSAAACVACAIGLWSISSITHSWKKRRRVVRTAALTVAVATFSTVLAAASGGWVFIDYLRREGPVVLLTLVDGETQLATIVVPARDGYVLFVRGAMSPTFIPVDQIKSISGGVYPLS